MTKERWERLSLFEQMSNIDGEVERLIDTKNRCDAGQVPESYIDSYLRRILDLIHLTLSDPKNRRRGPELLEEFYQIECFLKGEVDEDYIRRYWKQFTAAVSA